MSELAYPLPTLAQLGDEAQTQLIHAAHSALMRLAEGEDIEALSYVEVMGLVATREAELAAYVTELRRRHNAMNN